MLRCGGLSPVVPDLVWSALQAIFGSYNQTDRPSLLSGSREVGPAFVGEDETQGPRCLSERAAVRKEGFFQIFFLDKYPKEVYKIKLFIQ